MSVSSISQSDELGVDVLLIIFQHLDGEDLMNCEAVCRLWRDILSAGTPWRRLFHRKVESSPSWRKEQKKLEKNKLRTEQYRYVCRKIIQVERSWRMGRFKRSVHSMDEIGVFQVTTSDDFVAWGFLRIEDDKEISGCTFLDTESMEITEILLGYHILEEMTVRWGDRQSSAVEVRDPKNKWIVNVRNEEENVYVLRRMAFGSGRLVELSHKSFETERMRIWKMGDPPTLIHDRTFKNRILHILKVDEFIVAREDEYRHKTLYFFSTETLEVFTSLSLKGDKWKYNRGLLFQSRVMGIVRILDVATGTYFNDVRLPIRKKGEGFVHLLRSWASSNSSCMVIGWKYWNKKPQKLSCLRVYDLEAVKKQNSDPGCHLLYTLLFETSIEYFEMNERQIAFKGRDHKCKRSVTVLNFGNFNFAERKSSALKENPKDNEDFKMKIIYDPYVDSYPFHELNCVCPAINKFNLN